jgi:class 3 adenylate cyclase/Tfp pilus assembly protein PilF
MVVKRFIVLLGVLFIQLIVFGQKDEKNHPSPKDTAFVNSLIKKSASHFIDDQQLAIELAIQARDLSQRIHYESGLAYSYKNIGIIHYYQGDYFKSLENYNHSLKIFLSIKDNIGISNMYSNIGVIYYNQADYVKALENHLLSLKYAELTKDKLRLLTALNNVGGVYYIKPSTYDKALENYFRALPLCEELGDSNNLGTISVNIGNIYFNKGMDDEALSYFNKSLKAYGNSDGSQNSYIALGKLFLREGNYDNALNSLKKALSISENLKDDISTVQTLIVFGNLYVARADYKTALSYYNQAEKIAATMPPTDDKKDLYEAMAQTYNKLSDYHDAFKYLTLFSVIKDSIYNIAADKKLANLQFDFDLQKKEGEISLLTKDKALNELQIKKQTFARNAFAGGLLLVFLIAALLYRNFRAKVKTNKILDHKNAQIEHLILNILPSEVAHELQEKGRATPRNYDSVSVLFTDFKSFTKLTTNMNPEHLVEELNEWFMAFDDIVSKYNLEKIKTIGDSYMCAGGIPSPYPGHAYNIVKAGLEIQEHIAAKNKIRENAGLRPWDLRIGIHVGPLVAGVVGKKKYAYDIWGSTVNIASRMESNGEPGRVNISAQTYELVKDKFTCSYRGKIDAKNVGEVDMYFVEKEIFPSEFVERRTKLIGVPGEKQIV